MIQQASMSKSDLTWVSSINDNGGFHRLVVVFFVIIQIEQKR